MITSEPLPKLIVRLQRVSSPEAENSADRPKVVDDDSVGQLQLPGRIIRPASCLSRCDGVDQIDGIEEAPRVAPIDAGTPNAIARCDLAPAGRTRVILPNITTPMGGSSIGITSPRSKRGDPEAAAFRRDEGVCCSPAGRNVNACAVLDDAGSGCPSRSLPRATAGVAAFARPAHRDRRASSLLRSNSNNGERAGRCAP